MVLTSALLTLTSGYVFEYSDASLIFVFFASYSLSVMMFCYLMSSCFSRARMGSIIRYGTTVCVHLL